MKITIKPRRAETIDEEHKSDTEFLDPSLPEIPETKQPSNASKTRRNPIRAKRASVPVETPMPRKKPTPTKKRKYLALKRVLSVLLTKFIREDRSKVFYDPVSLEEVPDYGDVIKFPMDFSTMRKRLDANFYINFPLFVRDFELIMSNATTYNPAGTFWNAEAKRLLAMGKQSINEYVPKVDPKYLRADYVPKPKKKKSEKKKMSELRVTTRKKRRKKSRKTKSKKKSKTKGDLKKLASAKSQIQNLFVATTSSPTQRLPARFKRPATMMTTPQSTTLSDYAVPSTVPKVISVPKTFPLLTCGSTLPDFVTQLKPNDAMRIQKFISDMLSTKDLPTQKEVADPTNRTNTQSDLDPQDEKFIDKLMQDISLENFDPPTEQIQTELNKNFEMLCLLQIHQYARASSTPPDYESKLAQQLHSKLSHLTGQIQPRTLSLS
eukprot:TRINITY_DN1027_c0_g1_i5.p1 TRINITY_DN1027_c0_g1~~TRINITY_DN1027_c0_g1_i5.p1  ORF type:complete len:436 (-),score=81.94 TRINITY_DN1027_c0_g1_i5:1307-2614(-)